MMSSCSCFARRVKRISQNPQSCNFNHLATVHGVVFTLGHLRGPESPSNHQAQACDQAAWTGVNRQPGNRSPCARRGAGRAQYPDFLDTTYRDARNNLAYDMK
jgi:hypothetical protein